MNHDETRQLLRTRSTLTSQPYGTDAINAWHHALHEWTLEECHTALITAAREEKLITIAHLVQHLPNRRPPISTQQHYTWNGPTDKGRATATMIRNHMNNRTQPDHHCPICTDARYPSITEEP